MGAGKYGAMSSPALDPKATNGQRDETKPVLESSSLMVEAIGKKAVAGGGLKVKVPEAGERERGPKDPPRWYSPIRLMALFCYVMFITYTDIGLFASNGVTGTEAADGSVEYPGIKQAFNLSDTKLGLLPTLFMIGLMISSGILTVLANHFNAFRLVGMGVLVWCLGLILTGSSQEFYSLSLGRILVGAGEASVMMLAGPFIDDVAPPKHRTLYLAILSVFPPAGNAAGYMAGNLVKVLSWRHIFFILALLGVPVILFCLLAPAIELKGATTQIWDPEDALGEIKQLGRRATLIAALKEAWNDIGILHKHPVYVTSIYGHIPVVAVLGSVAFWGPKAVMQIFQVASGRVDFIIGITTVTTAITGIVGGGWFLDKMGSSLRKGMIISTAGSAVAMTVFLISFLVVKRINMFFGVFAIGLLALFITTSPLYAISMWSVPVQQRAASQAFRTIILHLLGDVPSPAIIGAVQDHVHNWRATMAGLCLTLALCVLVTGIGIFYAGSAPDYREPHGKGKAGVSDPDKPEATAPILPYSTNAAV